MHCCIAQIHVLPIGWWVLYGFVWTWASHNNGVLSCSPLKYQLCWSRWLHENDVSWKCSDTPLHFDMLHFNVDFMIWGFPQMGGTPKTWGFIVCNIQSHEKMDDNWGYPHFRKPPFLSPIFRSWILVTARLPLFWQLDSNEIPFGWKAHQVGRLGMGAGLTTWRGTWRFTCIVLVCIEASSWCCSHVFPFASFYYVRSSLASPLQFIICLHPCSLGWTGWIRTRINRLVFLCCVEGGVTDSNIETLIKPFVLPKWPQQQLLSSYQPSVWPKEMAITEQPLDEAPTSCSVFMIINDLLVKFDLSASLAFLGI